MPEVLGDPAAEKETERSRLPRRGDDSSNAFWAAATMRLASCCRHMDPATPRPPAKLLLVLDDAVAADVCALDLDLTGDAIAAAVASA